MSSRFAGPVVAVLNSVLAVGCTSVVPAQEVIVLHSGREISVIQKKAWNFVDGSPPALQLQYETTLSPTDSLGLKQEAREIWAVFAPEVEERGYSAAILTATWITGRTAVSIRFRTLGFVLVRDNAGKWTNRLDGVQW